MIFGWLKRNKELEDKALKANNDAKVWFDAFVSADQKSIDYEDRIEKVLAYCETHTDQMWAAYVVGTLLKCDFRDSKTMLKLRKEVNRSIKDILK